jgi:adenylate cyclase
MQRRRLIRRLLSAVGVTAFVATLAAFGLTSGGFDGFQRRASDSSFPSAKTDSAVIVVGIDSTTVSKVGEVPIPRGIDATLGGMLADAGAKAVVWDLIFSSPRAGDPELASALSAAPSSVLAEVLRLNPGPDKLLQVTSVDATPLPSLTTAKTTTVGHSNVTPDPTDGVIRTVPLVVENHGRLIPSLSLAALRAFNGETGPLTVRPDGVQVGGKLVPTEGSHLLRLNFASGLSSATASSVVSASDVLAGKVNPARFRGKVVLIGATAPILGDTKLVPVDKSNTFPGVMIHANALNTMLTASYLSPVSDTTTVAWVALIALLVAIAVLFLPVFLAVLASLIVAGGYLVVAYLRFDDGHVMNFVYPFGTILLAFIAALGIRYVTETRQRRRVSSLFAQYVPESVARQLEESGALDSHLEGERLDVGLFFCDLRGFTSLSSKLEPTQVRAMLNRFYDLLTEIILTHGGTVLKFVGDEVFAVFGAPLPLADNVQATLDAAIEIQTRGHELDSYLATLEIPPVQFGIGMNAGPVVAAHVGGGNRRQYDIVGDTVNLGARLCSQAGKGEIVLSEAMLAKLTTKPATESMGKVALKGLDEPVPLVKVVVNPETAVAR